MKDREMDIDIRDKIACITINIYIYAEYFDIQWLKAHY